MGNKKGDNNFFTYRGEHDNDRLIEFLRLRYYNDHTHFILDRHGKSILGLKHYTESGEERPAGIIWVRFKMDEAAVMSAVKENKGK
jgi:hypothetical protein